jgi:Holliday junction resolvase RusA-like endonuclease
MPPSTNLIWRSDRGRVHKSKAYTDWLKQAGYEWLRQRREQSRSIDGNFKAILVLDKGQRSRKDLDNRIKAVLDFCAENDLVEDDKLCDAILVKWGLAPLGAHIVLKNA